MAEARRTLPRLVRRAANGAAPIAIGRRGKAEAVLAPTTVIQQPRRRRSLQGLVRIVGGPGALAGARAELAAEVRHSLDQSASALRSRSARR